MSVNGTIPRWKKLLEAALEKQPKSTVIQLATVDTGTIPRVRSIGFREFFESPNAPGFPLLIGTTDARTPKFSQILSNPNVEVAWYIEETEEQFRISGRASLVAAPQNPLYETAREQLLNNAIVDSEGGLAALGPRKYDWESKRIEAFKSLSAHTKAMWCRPAAGGSVLEGGQEEAKKWPERIEEPKEGDSEEVQKNWARALGNFALIIIEPSEVDYSTTVAFPHRRFNFARSVEGGWDEVEVVP